MLRRLEEAGAAAAVLPSLFEEQIVHDQMQAFEYYEDPANATPRPSPTSRRWWPTTPARTPTSA
jgi:hypothetical protein